MSETANNNTVLKKCIKCEQEKPVVAFYARSNVDNQLWDRCKECVDVRLYIAIPSNRDWKGKFGSSLACLISRLTGDGIKVGNEEFMLTNFFLRALGQSSCLSIARQSFVDEMISQDFTHWLSLDDDMTFPFDLVDRLIIHNKDVVSINARHKTEELKGSTQGIDGFPLNSSDKTGIEPLNTMGGAIFLAKIDKFKHIPKPHFQVIWSEQHQDYISEDVYFATLLKMNGVELWADHDTSKMVSHLGEKEFAWPESKTKLQTTSQLEIAKLKVVA